MIESIGNSQNYRPPPPSHAGKGDSLSSEQQSLIEETLSNYDSGNLTEQDAVSIADVFTEAGINPSAQFADLLAESGFDAREIGSLSGAGDNTQESGQRPPPPPQSSQNSIGGLDLSSVVDYLDGLSNNDYSNSANSTSLSAKLAEQFGLSEGQSLINLTA
jgi:hypothetical protein